jgi:hypothetical protein
MIKDSQAALARAKSLAMTLPHLSAALASAKNLEDAYAACHHLGLKAEELSELFDRVPQIELGFKKDVCEFPLIAVIEQRGEDWLESESAAGHFDTPLGMEN